MKNYILFTDRQQVKDLFGKIDEIADLTQVSEGLSEFSDVCLIAADDGTKSVDMLAKLVVGFGWRTFRVGSMMISFGSKTEKINVCFTDKVSGIFDAEIFSEVFTEKDILIALNGKIKAAKKQEYSLKVKRFLTKIGIYSNLLGYDYLLYAIDKVIEDRRLLNNLTTELYPLIAEKFSASDKNVERNIRNAIEVSYNRGKFYETANAYGGNFTPYEKPSNGEFIAFIVEEICL